MISLNVRQYNELHLSILKWEVEGLSTDVFVIYTEEERNRPAGRMKVMDPIYYLDLSKLEESEELANPEVPVQDRVAMWVNNCIKQYYNETNKTEG